MSLGLSLKLLGGPGLRLILNELNLVTARELVVNHIGVVLSSHLLPGIRVVRVEVVRCVPKWALHVHQAGVCQVVGAT